MASVLNLNNEVVKMRKDVKKVKVLTIRKLTRSISQLKSKKGTEELILKNQRRAQRLLEEIHTIKKLRPDDVTKIGLQKEMNFEKVCKKPDSTAETRAVARLATHPLLKQKISTIKDAIKAFKEARKIAAKQEAEAEESCESEEHDDDMRTHTQEQCKQEKTKQKRKTVDTKPEDKSLVSPPCKIPNKETDLANTQRHKGNSPSSQNVQGPALLSIPKVSAEREPVSGVPVQVASLSVTKVSAEREPVSCFPEKVASLSVPKVSAEREPVSGVPEQVASLSVTKVSAEREPVSGVPEKVASLSVPKVSAERESVSDVPEKPSSLSVSKVLEEREPVIGVPEKPASITVSKVSIKWKQVEGVPEKPRSLTVPKVSAEKKSVVGSPEKQVLQNKIGEKRTPVRDSGSDSSDIEDSDNEDKEYFDDSTEERFYKQSSGFEDTDSDSGDDFFLGKVRQTKKKKSRKNPSEDKVEKKALQTQTTKPSAGGTESQRGNPDPKTVKLESVFFSSLSDTKKRPSYIKRETKVPPIRNNKAVVPQAPKLVRKPPAARNSAVTSQSKPAAALHPSWEASKKRKEQSQIAVFQGKKIVFDD